MFIDGRKGLIINGKVEKTQRLQVGSYYWTITSLAVGVHTLTIRAYSDDGLEDVTLTLTLEVEKGIYTPVEDYNYELFDYAQIRALEMELIIKKNPTSMAIMEKGIY